MASWDDNFLYNRRVYSRASCSCGHNGSHKDNQGEEGFIVHFEYACNNSVFVTAYCIEEGQIINNI